MNSLLEMISRFFQVPSSWLQWPDVFFWIILPFIILMYFFKIFLYEKIRLFRSETACWFLAVLLSLFLTIILRLGRIGVIIGIIAIMWFKVENVILRIILIIIALLILFNLDRIIQLITVGIT